MKKLLMVIPTVFLLCFTCGCQQGEKVARETEVDIEVKNEALRTLRDTHMSWSQAASELETFMSFIADDVIWLWPKIPPIIGKSDTRAYFEPVYVRPGFSLSFNIERIEVSNAGDMGYVFGYYNWTYKDSSDHLVEETHHYATVWRKNSSGEWRVVLEADYF